ncbi:sporulation protein YpjB [Paenibacillus nasutitermitis]|uniref:Sporulation protein YpjB n=1 Tax=Paenibacillus nasutitermitis TaxID=1652958 RepID=A0A916YZU2_9BACL|nr:sporulation protein YpjB [Paenibacillus nasutitermitis]GGD69032.1 hypothetical protein GCM10010911_28540 [Paenibacillus nasutitermitis]
MKLSLSGLIVGLAVLFIVAGCSGKGQNQIRHVQAMNSLNGSLPVSLESLEELSEAFYASANKGNRQLSYTLLERIRQAARLPEVRQYGTQAGWKAWDSGVENTRVILARNASSLAWINEAARMKLAVDVLINPQAPLWLQYKEVMQDDWNRVRLAWKSQTAGHAQAALRQLDLYDTHAKRIELAALMQRPEAFTIDLRKRMDYVRQVLETKDLNSGSSTNVTTALVSLEDAAESLFGRKEAEDALALQVPQLSGENKVGEQLAVLYISAFVMGILAFSGWRRFAYEQKHGSSIPSRKGR